MQDWNVLAPSNHSDHFARDHLPPQNEWPVFQADVPELQYPAILNCGAELVDRHVAEGRGERIAIRGMAPGPAGPVEIAWTYAQLTA
jgi:2-aminobenzoate-CoA ligase